ncbi:PH domain-containing protein [Geodermatophilus sp. DSM 44513]|uniref:PH domain-containing protein n=1 Tax=Geodermatophilus sp. DSM 44513 TaxID=1528104 RepID=UPI0028F703EF|nr:PH domain-containing protein [Geodermatophilus sp. DSM 44513]WNV74722.1 PH domain-containing protein [Geodermatophilus sp. DSM 44513]
MSEPAPGPTGGSRSVWRRDAEKYLLPQEQPPVVATRRHWAVLVAPVVRAVPVLAAGGWLMLLDPDDRVTTSVGLVLLLGALVFLALRVGEWWMRHFIVTNRRVLLTTGIVVRTVALLPLRRITDLTYKETLFGQLLGYGTFRFESAGQQQALSEITYLPRAGVLYRDVSDLLFGGGGADSGDDEGNPEPPPGPGRRTPPADRAAEPEAPPPRRPRTGRVAGRRVREGRR